jgi:hypothetical protein
MSAVAGAPLSAKELSELCRLLVIGGHNIYKARASYREKCRSYHRQLTCLSMVEIAPDLVRLELAKARDILKEKNDDQR